MKYNSASLTLATICLLNMIGSQLIEAAVVIEATETSVGLGQVELTFSGSLNVADLTPEGSFVSFAQVIPDLGFGSFGGFGTGYTGLGSAPSSFGTGPFKTADVSDGDFLSMDPSRVYVPFGYTSGTEISGTMSFAEFSSPVTFDSLGLTEDSYVWSWGTGTTADSITLNIGTTIPEPSSATIAFSLAIFTSTRRRQNGCSGAGISGSVRFAQ